MGKIERDENQNEIEMKPKELRGRRSLIPVSSRRRESLIVPLLSKSVSVIENPKYEKENAIVDGHNSK